MSDKKSKVGQASSSSSSSKDNNEEDEITRLAMEELSKGAKRMKERSQTMGALGWKKSPVPSANKVYLQNTIIGALQSNVRVDKNCSRDHSTKSYRVTTNKKEENTHLKRHSEKTESLETKEKKRKKV